MRFIHFLPLFLSVSIAASIPCANETKTPRLSFKQFYKLQTNFLDNFLCPNSAKHAEAINSTLFSPDIQGRIDVTRTFDGVELNTEYLFGLFANLASSPNSLSLLGLPISYQITHFAANDYITSVATRFMFNSTSIGQVLPVQIDGWHIWNEKGR